MLQRPWRRLMCGGWGPGWSGLRPQGRQGLRGVATTSGEERGLTLRAVIGLGKSVGNTLQTCKSPSVRQRCDHPSTPEPFITLRGARPLALSPGSPHSPSCGHSGDPCLKVSPQSAVCAWSAATGCFPSLACPRLSRVGRVSGLSSFSG